MHVSVVFVIVIGIVAATATASSVVQSGAAAVPLPSHLTRRHEHPGFIDELPEEDDDRKHVVHLYASRMSALPDAGHHRADASPSSSRSPSPPSLQQQQQQQHDRKAKHDPASKPNGHGGGN